MSTWTERLLQVTLVAVLLYCGWQVAAQTIVAQINLQTALSRCQNLDKK